MVRRGTGLLILKIVTDLYNYILCLDGQEGYWIINAKDGNGSVEFNGTGQIMPEFNWGISTSNFFKIYQIGGSMIRLV